MYEITSGGPQSEDENSTLTSSSCEHISIKLRYLSYFN